MSDHFAAKLRETLAKSFYRFGFSAILPGILGAAPMLAAFQREAKYFSAPLTVGPPAPYLWRSSASATTRDGGDMESYKFKLGQLVSIVGGRRQGAMPGGRFEIVRLLPETGGSNQYRVRSKHDGHERVVLESELV